MSFILKTQIPSQKDSIMNTNITELLSLRGFELAKLGDQCEVKYGYESNTSNTEDVTKLLALNTKATSNKGIEFEMQALGFGGEVKSLINGVKRDLIDWDNVIG